MYALASWGKCSWNKTYLDDRLVLQKQDGFRDEAKTNQVRETSICHGLEMRYPQVMMSRTRAGLEHQTETETERTVARA
jgi:hypothetical protein